MQLSNQPHVQLSLQLLLNVYYFVKPAIPYSMRLALRRAAATPIRAAYASTWPINEASAKRPDEWPGWPDGKRLAIALTHDVEGRRGLERCRQLAELEIRLGLRSTFMFVPEGEYETPADLRAYLTSHGFEVGVHDLHHDGSLYTSRRAFEAQAATINRYLAEWRAVGFRSGFMRHNLTWLKQLNVLYDASTFDSDPFEPQPDGMNTIFPCWVPRSDGSGYVELPYTLAQDSTLFLVLRERGNDIWKRKLDWVASHGGMALLDTHPDYMSFTGAGGSAEYPVALYEDFLRHALERYREQAWFATAREVAEYYSRTYARLPQPVAI